MAFRYLCRATTTRAFAAPSNASMLACRTVVTATVDEPFDSRNHVFVTNERVQFYYDLWVKQIDENPNPWHMSQAQRADVQANMDALFKKGGKPMQELFAEYQQVLAAGGNPYVELAEKKKNVKV